MPAPTQPHRPVVAVVGGGIAGIAAAWALTDVAEPPHVVLLEASGRVGGKLEVSGLDGIAVDVGAESLLARRPEALDFARAVGLGGDLVTPRPASALIWSGGRLHPLPAGTLMGVPSVADGLAGLLAPSDVEAVQAEAGRHWTPIATDVDVASFVRERVGAGVVERLVEPLLGGVYAGRADRLSLQATVPALWAAAAEGRSIVHAARAAAESSAPDSPVFAGIRGGVGRLPQAAVQALQARGVEVLTRATVRSLGRTPEGWHLVVGPTTDERALLADAVILATPAAPTSRLLRNSSPTAATLLADIDYASVAIVTMVLARSAHSFEGSGFLVPPVDRRVVKAATFSSSKWQWLDGADAERVVVRTSVGRHGDVADLQRDDAGLVSLASADLAAATGQAIDPQAACVTRWGGGLPQYAVGHVQRVAAVREAVARVPGLAVAGAAYDGVGVPACIASGARAAQQVHTHLRERAGQARE